MIALLLAAAPLPQAPAGLHPEHVVLYAELPDMGRVLGAYPNTATARLLADPEVRTAFADLLDSFEGDLEGMQQQLAQHLASATALPPEAVLHPIATLHSYLSLIESASVSVSLDETRTGEFAETIVRMDAAVEELQTIQDALYLHAVDHDGRYPGTLDDLGLTEAQATDPWGRPYVYAVLSDGAGFELHALGADGALGGDGQNSDLSASSDLHAQLLVEAERRLGLTVTMSFRDVAPARAVHGMLRDLAARAGLSPAAGFQPAASSDVDLAWFDGAPWDARAAGGPGLWALRSASLVAIGAGSSDPEALLARAAGGERTALDSRGYRELTRRFGEREGAALGTAFVEFSDLLGALQQLDPVEGINWGLLGAYATSTWRTALLPDGRFVTETYALAPGENELAQCIAHEPVPEGIWRFIPDDSIGVYTSSIDAPRLYDSILEAVQADLPDHHESALSRLEETYGFSLRDDVFGSFGSGVGAYLLPISGLLSPPGGALVAELDDPERFQRGLEGVLRFLEDEAGGEFEVKFRPYREAPLWFFSFQGTPIPISPTLAVVDGHLLVTLNSTRAKKEIKRIQSLSEPGAEPPASHPARALAPEEASMVGYMDWAALIAGAYDGGKAALAMFGGNLDLPVDTTLLPETELLTRYHRPSVYWTRVTDDAIYSRGESSFGPETLLGLGALVGVGAAGGALMQPGQPGPSGAQATEQHLEVHVVSEESPAELRDQTRKSLRFLATRLAVYKLESGGYPATLSVLVEPTSDYPRGFLDGRELPLDAWDNAFAYSVSDAGTGYRLWSLGPDGVDQDGQGDDLVE